MPSYEEIDWSEEDTSQSKNKLSIEEDDMPRFPIPQSSLSAEEWSLKDNELELSCPAKDHLSTVPQSSRINRTFVLTFVIQFTLRSEK